MTTSLLDSLKGVVSPELSTRLASSLGEPPENVTTGLNGGMSSMLLGMLGKSRDAGSMGQLFGLITNGANDGRVLDDPAALVGSPADSPIAMLGRQFLSSIFGARAGAVNDALAKQTGLRLGSVASLLQLAAPLFLGVLGKRVRDGGLTADSLGRLLNDERDSIQRAAPAGVMSAVGLEQRTPETEVVLERETFRENARAYTPEPTPSSGRRWLWPAAIAAALLLFWGLSRRHREPNVAFTDTTHTGVSGGEVVPPTVAPSTTMPSSPSAPATSNLQLPGGGTLDVSSASTEGRIVGFLTDPSRAPDDTTWFALDQTQFDDNSAHLKPESNPQLQRIAKIMKAYPNAVIRVAGFTSTAPNDAANKKLSRERAQNARLFIIKSGIPANRISAEGFGAAAPRGDTAMSAGAAGDRVALLIVKK